MNESDSESLREESASDGGPPSAQDTANAEPGHSATRDLALGTILFDRFELIAAPGRNDSLIGQGGMGVIHRAKDALLDRIVAIKLPPQNVILDEAAKLDLLAETRQALALTHPNIVRVYDYHESPQNALWGISMQYVNGINLSEMRSRLGPGSHARKPFTVERIRPWIRQICEALVHAHEFAGFVHRDLNPKNIMLEITESPGEEQAREHILITDFGIAATIRHSMEKSRREDRRGWNGAGTLPYMPWEQIMGQRPSASNDIYALGATLYDLLTTTPPFSEGPQESILAQIEQAIPPTMTVRRRELDLATPDPIPPEWEEVVRDCLRKDPAQRPVSVREMAARLGFDLPSRSSSPAPRDETVPETRSQPGAPSARTGRQGPESGSTTRRSGRFYQSESAIQRTESKRLAAVMFTDIVGSVALQQRLGTVAYTELVAQHDQMFESALMGADDAEVLNETGDGFLVRFSEPSDAVETALRLQFLAAKTLVEGEPIGIRIGIHLGVITEMAERVRGQTRSVGMALNLAARVMDTARPGQILLTRAIFDDARQFVRAHPPVEGWSDPPPVVWMVHGDYVFKGSDDPLALFEVGAEGIAPLEAPGDAAKGRRVSGSGSSQVIKSLPRPRAAEKTEGTPPEEAPNLEQLKQERDQSELAHRELQAEIERLRESEIGRARELKQEAELLARERARLESLSTELAARRDEEERINSELRERALREVREVENRSEEVSAELAARKLAFERAMERKAGELESAARQRLEALEDQEREILEGEKRLSDDRSARNERSLQLVRERERLKSERAEFQKEMEARRGRIEEEKQTFLRAQEEERARADAELQRELAQKEASHAAAVENLQRTLAEQESALRQQSGELAQAEERIREMQGNEAGSDNPTAPLVVQLAEEARRFEARITELDSNLARIRHLQKRRITAIAVGSVILALGVGLVSAKLIWGFWPWKLFTSPAETQPNVVLEGLRQLEREGDWLGLLSASIPASRQGSNGGEDGAAAAVASLTRNALHHLAEPSERGWESDPSRLLDYLDQLEENDGTLPSTHGFLVAKIRITEARRSPRRAGVPGAVAAYLSYQAHPASPELSAELERDLNSLLGDLLDQMDDASSLADEDALLGALAAIPEEVRGRTPLARLVEGRLRLRGHLRERPPGLAAALVELDHLEAADGTWKARLRNPFEQIVSLLGEDSQALPPVDALLALATRWNDPRPLVPALGSLEMRDPAFATVAEKLWRDFHVNRAQSADPLPEDAAAWIGWLGLNGNDQGESRKGLENLRKLAAGGNALAGYFLVDHALKLPPNAESDLAGWARMAEAALEGGENGSLVQLGDLHWRIGIAAPSPEEKAASLRRARENFQRAAAECERRSDRETAVIMHAGLLAESGAKGLAERREMADITLRAGTILWRSGEIGLARDNWDKAWEADPEIAGHAVGRELENPSTGDDVKDALKSWRETKTPLPPGESADSPP